MTRALIAIAALSALLGALAGPARADGTPTLTETSVSPEFPARSFVLHLPRERAVTRSNIEVTENGEPVRDLRVSSSAAAGSAIVLAIDASFSMGGGPIVDAMEAARTFAARRPC
jgi:hypothetical protein